MNGELKSFIVHYLDVYIGYTSIYNKNDDTGEPIKLLYTLEEHTGAKLKNVNLPHPVCCFLGYEEFSIEFLR